MFSILECHTPTQIALYFANDGKNVWNLVYQVNQLYSKLTLNEEGEEKKGSLFKLSRLSFSLSCNKMFWKLLLSQVNQKNYCFYREEYGYVFLK